MPVIRTKRKSGLSSVPHLDQRTRCDEAALSDQSRIAVASALLSERLEVRFEPPLPYAIEFGRHAQVIGRPRLEGAV
jgi:hypothetical protein